MVTERFFARDRAIFGMVVTEEVSSLPDIGIDFVPTCN
jgi:hypothetical protein